MYALGLFFTTILLLSGLLNFYCSPREVNTVSIKTLSIYKPDITSFSKAGFTVFSKPSFFALTIKPREPIKDKFKTVAHLRACKSSRTTPYPAFFYCQSDHFTFAIIKIPTNDLWFNHRYFLTFHFSILR